MTHAHPEYVVLPAELAKDLAGRRILDATVSHFCGVIDQRIRTRQRWLVQGSVRQNPLEPESPVS